MTAPRILHMDMDAFYASVEQVDQPALKGKPVIVGGAHRGVVTTASYEARHYGVRSAMPMFQAHRLCPRGIFLPVRMKRYKEVSRQVMTILSAISPLLEQVSIDEAYVDITGTEVLHGEPAALAEKVKQAVRDATGLTCSIGIAPNRFLAKIASDMNKPDGLTIIEEQDVADFLRVLPVTKIPGIGEKTARVFSGLGVHVVSDILRYPLAFWVNRLGKSGAKLYEKARGIGSATIVCNTEPQSCSAEDTFSKDTDDLEEIKKWLLGQAESVGRDLRKQGYRGRTITLKVKFSDFNVVTRSRTLPEPTNSTRVIFDTVLRLLGELRLKGTLRLAGVGVSNFAGGLQQGRLFRDDFLVKQEQLDRAVDHIHEKFGDESLKRGRLFDSE